MTFEELEVWNQRAWVIRKLTRRIESWSDKTLSIGNLIHERDTTETIDGFTLIDEADVIVFREATLKKMKARLQVEESIFAQYSPAAQRITETARGE